MSSTRVVHLLASRATYTHCSFLVHLQEQDTIQSGLVTALQIHVADLDFPVVESGLQIPLAASEEMTLFKIEEDNVYNHGTIMINA